MSELYTAAPANVPETLTAPSKNYKRKVTYAFLGLLAFIVVYFTLMIWFGRLAFRLFNAVSVGIDNSFRAIIVGVFMTFLCFFMLKSLFIFKKHKHPEGHELKPEDEPVLFEFLYKLADEAKAPRPHRVFLSDKVNACVFYELSLINLIYPTKKNLEIGLGLVNVLNVGEFKAVLAHEFGHFAQKSMLLGRYVYMAQKIAFRVVNKRDAFDNFLSGLSRVDLRVAWIGWILSILVWAIRSLVEVLFNSISVLEKAVSREMEFQADLVAVSLTGSDALINGLSKLRAADEAYDAALAEVNFRLGEKMAVRDLFTLQSAYIEKMRWIKDDPSYGSSPDMNELNASKRIFSRGVANPPQMWSTHPNDKDREENAKATYIKADINPESSEILFSNSIEKREALTKELIATAKVETQLLSNEDGQSGFEERLFDWAPLHPKYRGFYYSRFIFQDFKLVDEIFDIQIGLDLKKEYETLYPANLSDLIEQQNEIIEEISALKMFQNETLTAEKRVVMHRGNEIKRREIPAFLLALNQEELELRKLLIDEGRKIRKVNYETCLQLNADKAQYLKDLCRLIHYAEHRIADLVDARGKLENTIQISVADGRVSDSEWDSIIEDAYLLESVLESIYAQRTTIQIGSTLMSKLGEKGYAGLMEDYVLGSPKMENFERWYNNLDTWVSQARFALYELRNGSLAHLLELEDEIKKAYLSEKLNLSFSSDPITIPEEFKLLLPGQERKLTLKLGLWDRFQVGDGIFPTLAKLGVAASLIGMAVFVGSMSQSSSLWVYNGLDRQVEVNINGTPIAVLPHTHHQLEVNFDDEFEICSTIGKDTVEMFFPKTLKRTKHLVYNIGGASSFLEHTVSYGFDGPSNEVYRGSERWFSSSADFIFKEAPSTIQLRKKSSTTRRALVGLSNYPVHMTQEWIRDPQQLKETSIVQAIWSSTSNPNLLDWITLASNLDSTLEFLDRRLELFPDDVFSCRAVMDFGNDKQKSALCSTIEKKSAQNPNDGNLYYLKVRCQEDGTIQDRNFLLGKQKWPNNPWLNYAVAHTYVTESNWADAYDCYSVIIDELPSLAIANSVLIEGTQRMCGFSSPMTEAFLKKQPVIQFVRNIEGGIDSGNMSPYDKALFEIHHGAYDQALSTIRLTLEDVKKLNWFVAGSKNVSQKVIDEALSMSALEGIDHQSIFMAIALKAKEEMDYSSLINKLTEIYNPYDLDRNKIAEFVVAVKNSKFDDAENIVQSFRLPSQILPKFYLIGCIIHGKFTPQKWRKSVKNLLMVYEKPYLDL